MNVSSAAVWATTICCLFLACKPRSEAATAQSPKYPSGFDTTKFKQANENPQEITMLRMMAPKLKPNGYFFGAPGVMPNGDVFMDILKQSPQYDKRGFVNLYYMYLVDNHDFLYDDFHASKLWPAAKIDTFKFYFGKP